MSKRKKEESLKIVRADFHQPALCVSPFIFIMILYAASYRCSIVYAVTCSDVRVLFFISFFLLLDTLRNEPKRYLIRS